MKVITSVLSVLLSLGCGRAPGAASGRAELLDAVVPADPRASDDSGEVIDPLEGVIRSVIEAHEPVPHTGVAIAVLEYGAVRLLQGYGYRDRVAELPVTVDTLFEIGSTTKALTSFLALTLVADGLMSLDTPVVETMSDFATADPVATAGMTMLDLLAHRAGLARHDSMWLDGHYSRAEIYARLGALEDDPDAGFRSSIIYNNLMYLVAGVLMERLAGESWEKLLQQRILDPLGMERTVATEAGLLAAEDHALGYSGELALEPTYVDAIGPAGSIASSVREMAAWVQMLLAGGVTQDGRRLLETQTLELAYQTHNPLPEDGYGLGWAVKDLGGYRFIGHGGHMFGYFASISFIPELGLGVIALFNDDLTQLSIPVVTEIYGALLSGTGYPVGASRAVRTYLKYASETHGLIIPKPERPLPAKVFKPPVLAGARASVNFRHSAYGDLCVLELATPGTYAVEWRDNVWPLSHYQDLTYIVSRYRAGSFTYLPLTYVREGADIVALTIPFGTFAHESRFERVP